MALCSCIAVAAVASFPASAKSAIVMAHYGSSDDETRSRTISVITDEVKREFPAIEVREAYISPVVRRSLAERGVRSLSPIEALLGLRAEGYDSVYVQSSTLLDGGEMAEVRKAVDQVSQFFKLARVGRPLLYSPDDCKAVAGILERESCGENEAVVYVGHGNALPSTAAYSQLDHMLGSAASGVYHVSTIEGYPTVQSTVSQLRKNPGVNTVKLIPLLLVCGNHTKSDIAGWYSDAISEAGYATQVVMRGLGESPAIRQLYVDRVRELLGE